MTIDITKIQGILEQLSTVHNNRPDTKLSVIQYTVAKALAFDAPIHMIFVNHIILRQKKSDTQNSNIAY
jgi:hypothetical protein